MKKNWDAREREYVFDHAGWIDEAGVAHFHHKDFNRMVNIGVSAYDKNVRTLMIPTVNGMSLILEGKHFVVV